MLKASPWDLWGGSLQLIHSAFFLSVVNASDANDEGSSGEAEEPAVDLSEEGSNSEESTIDPPNEGFSSEKAAVDLSDEYPSSEESGSTVERELSDGGGGF